MNKILKICFFACTILVSNASAQEKAENILGKWITGSGDAKISVFKSGDQYYGSIAWLKNPVEDGKPKVDKNNPDARLRSKPLMGLLILRGFKYEGNNIWSGGRIYDPKNGKDYSCKITLAGKDKLNVRGYIGISLIGRTDTWTRAE